MSIKRIHGIFTLRSPLSHIGEAISTNTYLVTEPIIQPDYSLEEVPVYNGNAWRGALRDQSAVYMLNKLENARVPLDIFHLLFSGGRIGGEQSIDIAQARKIRAAIPMISLFGGGVGNQIMQGKLRVSSLYPIVREAIPVLPKQWIDTANKLSMRGITFEKSFSRMDDAKREDMQQYLPAPDNAGLIEGKKKVKEKGDVADQMRMTTELLVPGLRMYSEIDVLDASDIELGAFVSAIHSWSQSPVLGGQSNKGHGRVTLEYHIIEMTSGNDVPFIRVGNDNQCLLSPPAQMAKDAYDQHLRELYDAMLIDNSKELRGLIGAV